MYKFSPRQWHNCATCGFWDGKRRVTEHGAAEAERNARGECLAHSRNAEKYATASCIAWRLWDDLQVAHA